MKNEIKHRHHLIPRHMGGGNEEENLTPPISIETHAAFHKQLWEDFGKQEDFIAWKCLSGRITPEEARLAAALEGQKHSVLYKETRAFLGAELQKHRTKESCSKGGTRASKALIKWQKENEAKFKEQCSLIGKQSAERRKIPHSYLGFIFDSKKSLQKEYKMCNNKFYKLLSEGVIKRVDKLVEAYEHPQLDT